MIKTCVSIFAAGVLGSQDLRIPDQPQPGATAIDAGRKISPDAA
jgi:hypothetical protein